VVGRGAHDLAGVGRLCIVDSRGSTLALAARRLRLRVCCRALSRGSRSLLRDGPTAALDLLASCAAIPSLRRAALSSSSPGGWRLLLFCFFYFSILYPSFLISHLSDSSSFFFPLSLPTHPPWPRALVGRGAGRTRFPARSPLPSLLDASSQCTTTVTSNVRPSRCLSPDRSDPNCSGSRMCRSGSQTRATRCWQPSCSP